MKNLAEELAAVDADMDSLVTQKEEETKTVIVSEKEVVESVVTSIEEDEVLLLTYFLEKIVFSAKSGKSSGNVWYGKKTCI